MSDLDAILREGVAAHQAGRLDDARAMYVQVLQANPEDPNALNLLGTVYHQQGRQDEAELLIRKAIQLAPNIAGFYNNLGNVLLMQHRLEHAQEAYEKAVSLQNDYAEAINNLGVALLGQGKVPESMTQFVTAINLRPDYPSARNNLGNALRSRSRLMEAAGCYRDAIAQKSDYFEAHANLAVTLYCMAQCEEAIEQCAAALAIRPNDPGATLTRGLALEKLGRKDEAIASYRETLRLRPSSRGVRFQLAALTGEEQFPAAPPEFVTMLFDNYAETFDWHLVQKLKYRGPEIVFEALQAAGIESASDAVDLGCGTGLCGKLLRPHVKHLVGVDISSRMIGQARDRNVYDELFVDEITAFLAVRFAQFDVAVSADVLIYLGDLRPLFAGVAQALRPGGVFAFTVEKHDGDGYALNATRRYAHSIAYLRQVTKAAGLQEISAAEKPLRVESGIEVSGLVMAVRR